MLQVPPVPGGRLSLRRGLALAAALVVVGWGVAVALTLLGAKADAEAGRDRLQALRDDERLTRRLLDGGATELDAAAADFGAARDAVRRPWVAPLRVLPVVGRQVRALDALAGAAAEVTTSGSGALAVIERRLAAGTDAGGERVALVDAVGVAALDVTATLEAVDLGPGEALVGPLADARRDFATEIDDVEELVRDASAVASGLGPMLRGPSRYLVLAGNNAEMQAGSGMFLSAGELTITDGALELGDMQATGDVVVPAGTVPLDPDVAARWGWAAPERDLRDVNLTPRFEVSAAQAARMWEAAGGNPVDGVLALDPVALAAVLEATGPVEVGGATYDASTVVDQLLHQQYVEFPDAQDARRDRQGEVARAAVDALDRGGWEPADLFDDLAAAARGRHILVWSPRSEQQAAWQAAEVDGAVEPGSLLVSLLNTSGTKLDYFLDVEAALEVAPAPPGSGQGAEGTLRVRVRNDVPPGEPRYVAGPNTEGLAEGEHEAILSVTLPGEVVEAGVAGVDGLVAAGPDGPTEVVATAFRLPRGAEIEREVRFRLPPGLDALVLEPAARYPALRWRLDGEVVPADQRRYVAW